MIQMRKLTKGQLRLWSYRRRRVLRRMAQRPPALELAVSGTRPPLVARPYPASSPLRSALRIELPAVMSLRRNREQTLAVYQAIRRATRKRRPLRLDFTTLRETTPAASLVLASEIDRWRRIQNIRPVVIDEDRWDPVIFRLFNDLGLFDLVKVQNPPTLTGLPEHTERYIRYRTGLRALGDEAVALRQAVEVVIGEELLGKSAMYRGVTEAMTNVHKHAYIAAYRDHTPILRDTWWIGGGFDVKQRRLRVLVFDQGVGIPVTLPRRYSMERVGDIIRGRGWKNGHAGRIAAAMELGKTRTGKQNQGRGLPDLLRFVNVRDRGSLRILSLRGEYLYVAGKQEQLVDHPTPLGGTLIQWEIDL